jgi:hypothetical protein
MTVADSGGGRRFRAGELVVCKVIADEPGGYSVTLWNETTNGFLETKTLLKPGDEVFAQCYCRSRGRMLLTASQLLNGIPAKVPKLDPDPCDEYDANGDSE